MDVLNVIKERRSIRIFSKDSVPEELIQKLLESAVLSPSGENRQPWRFVVLENDKNNVFVEILSDVMKKLNENGKKTGTFKRTIGCIKRANLIVLVFNTYAGSGEGCEGAEDFMRIVDIQSIGAAVQNMLLTAHDLGLGALWVCDILYAENEIRSWLDRRDELIGGVALGYADESPDARPRMPWHEVTEWLK